MSIVLATLGAEVEPQLGPLAAAYVLLLAIAGPILMHWSDVVLRLTGRTESHAPFHDRAPA
jgi:monovalent cation:H+ antiporter-2, CPA2 family